MRKIKRHLGKNIGKGTAKIAGLALASVIAAGSAFGVTGVSAMAADDAGITNTQGAGAEEPGEEQTGENQPGTEEPGEEPTGENQPGTEEPGEEPTGENQPGTEESGEEPTGEIQPGTEEPGEEPAGEIQPDIVEEPVLNLIQTEGGTITAEPIKSVLDAEGNDTYNKACHISVKADTGWYFKEWDVNFNTDKGEVLSSDIYMRGITIDFIHSKNYSEETGKSIITYGTANVSAVFEKLNEGEYAIYGSDGTKIIFAKAGEKVTVPFGGNNEEFDCHVINESDDSDIEYELDSKQKTISFIMPESNVIIVMEDVEFTDGSSNLPGEGLTTTPGDGTNEEDGEAKTSLPGTETKNTTVSTTAAPVKAGAPAAVYSAPVRNAGSSTTAAQTGDKTNTPIWIAAAAGSVAAALGALVIRRKKNSEE